MTVDAALSQSQGEKGWGGKRDKSWHENGKRAVVPVHASVYEVVVALAGLCKRSHKSLNAQIYAAGLEVLTGQDIDTLTERPFTVANGRRLARATTDDDVRAAAKAFTFEERP